jgi:fused signal recognition particle receptor
MDNKSKNNTAKHKEKADLQTESPLAKVSANDTNDPVVNSLRQQLSKTRQSFSFGLKGLLVRKAAFDDKLLEDLEELLITSDIGVKTTMDLMDKLSAKVSTIHNTDQLKDALISEILPLLPSPKPLCPMDMPEPYVIMVVGVNGVGKTTTVGKIAALYRKANKQVLIGAADTFRAAATEQIDIWASRSQADIVKHQANADPAAVSYDSIEAAIARKKDIVLIDTAGRLHTQVNLMEELKKIKRVITKRLPGAPHEILLILDATTGQNALSQAELFNNALGITDIALTKLDGTAKGGIAIAIGNTFGIPLKYIGVGEALEDMHLFNPQKFMDALFW